ncbi:MAG: phosphatidate cytidylyltransferase [Peptococcaceae bacterium]|nr:phosphatidate cytidylyltransferase [Peptococcaceae bacterium]
MVSMVRRLLISVIGIPILIYFTWLGGQFLIALLAVLAGLVLREFLKMGNLLDINPLKSVVWLLAAGWFILVFFKLLHYLIPYLLLAFLIIVCVYTVAFPRYTWKDAAWSLLSLIYPVALLSCFYPIRVAPEGFLWALYCLFIVWGTDTGAYFIGSLIGRHKIAPLMSPHKSYEGAVGGLVVSLAVGAGFWYFCGLAPLWAMLVLSFVASFFGQLGDMFESTLKRTAGIKDSGNLLPGHGGFMDRFDSFMFAVPVVFICLHYWIRYL